LIALIVELSGFLGWHVISTVQ